MEHRTCTWTCNRLEACPGYVEDNGWLDGTLGM